MTQILDVDLLAFESGTEGQRRAVIDAVRRSLATGFVYTSHDLSEILLDDAYGMLERFFSLPVEEKAKATVPGSHGQAGYTGLLVETAAISDTPDWKEMLNWGPGSRRVTHCGRGFPIAIWVPISPRSRCPVSPRSCSSSTTGCWSCSDGSFASSLSASDATRPSSIR
jgi:isopenicillin N synthase-like dioxygenase